MKTVFKVKKQCSVPGCSEIDCYSISRGSGGAVSMCRRCAEELLSEMTKAEGEQKSGNGRKKSSKEKSREEGER